MKRCIDGLSYNVAYDHDAAGNVTLVTTPDAVSATTAYAGLRPSNLTVGIGSMGLPIRDIAFHPFGPRTYATFPPADASGVNTVESARTVNFRGQIEHLAVTTAAGTILDRTYEYAYAGGSPGPTDPGPNLDRVIDAVDPAESHFFFYDALDRLDKATNLAGNPLFDFAYDAAGNRTGLVSGAASTSYFYETGTNRLNASVGASLLDYHHDAYGNRIYQGPGYAGTASLLYDDANRLREVRDPANGYATLATYRYDAFGRRIKKTTPTQTFLYLYGPDGQLLQEIEKKPGADDHARAYVYLEDELVAVVDSVYEVGSAGLWPFGALGWEDIEGPGVLLVALLGASACLLLLARRHPAPAAAAGSALLVVFTCAGTGRPPPSLSWVHTDPLGTPLAVTGTTALPAEAVAIWRASYEPFGRATVDEDPDGDEAPFSLAVRFPGQFEDAETGWHDNYFRTYDPSVGRYLEADPIGQKGGLNLYTYVENDPPNQVDPLGLTSFRCQKPLDRLGGPTPGSGTRSGPDFPSNPLYHQYICVATPAGITCGGQTAVGGDPWGEGLPSDDHFDPNRCEPTGPPDNCMDQCLLAAFTGKRPRYGLFGPYTNCQEWSNDALSLCERICRNRKKQ